MNNKNKKGYGNFTNILISFVAFAITLFFAVVLFKLEEDIMTKYILISVNIFTFTILLQSIQQCLKLTKIKYFVYGIFVFILMFCVLTTSLLIQNFKYYTNGVKTKAIITKVDKETRRVKETDEDGYVYYKDETYCTNYVEYKVNGKLYKNELDIESCFHKKGDKINIIYDKNDPSVLIEKGQVIVLILAVLLSYTILICFTYKCIKEK